MSNVLEFKQINKITCDIAFTFCCECGHETQFKMEISGKQKQLTISDFTCENCGDIYTLRLNAEDFIE